MRKPTRVLAVSSLKGGTGKTTTAVNLADALARSGARVLLVDLDPQGSVAASLGLVVDGRTTADLLDDDVPPRKCLVSARPGLDVIPADDRLARTEIHLARLDSGRDLVLRRRLAEFDERFDFVLLDGPPSYSVLNRNALRYASELVIPVAADFLSLEGLRQTVASVRKIVDKGADIRILGVLPTFFDGRLRATRETIDAIRADYRRVLSPIRTNTALAEAPAHGKTIFEWDRSSPGAVDYALLAEQVLEGPPRGKTLV